MYVQDVKNHVPNSTIPQTPNHVKESGTSVLRRVEALTRNGEKITWNDLQKFMDAVKRVTAKLKEVVASLKKDGEHSAAKEVENTIFDLERARGLYAKAYKATQKAVENRVAEQKVETKKVQKSTGADGGKSFSLKEFEDGKRFVDVEIDQVLFNGKTLKEQAMLARKVIKERFAGKVIGNINKVFVNGNSAEEYSWLSRSRDDASNEAKMRASTELDNLIDAGANFRNETDGKYGHIHEDAVGGFSYFEVVFKVGKEYYSGLINITNNSRGMLLKDVTQIKNITDDVTASYGENPASSFVNDVSNSSISQTNENSQENFTGREATANTQFSLKDDVQTGTGADGGSYSLNENDETKKNILSRENIDDIIIESENQMESGERSGSENTSRLEERRVDKSNDSLWHRSDDTQEIYESMGNRKATLRRGEKGGYRYIHWSRVFGDIDVYEQTEKEFASRVLREISGLEISDIDQSGSKSKEWA